MEMDLHQWQQLAIFITAVGGALTTIVAWKARIWPWLKHRWRTRSKVVMLETLARIERSTQTATAERQKIAHDFAELKREFVLFGASVRAMIASDDTLATFEASPAGLLIDANRTYLRWTGKTPAELSGWGWINSVHVQDRQSLRVEWESAVRDVRQAILAFRMLAADGSDFKVKATITPIPEGIVPCEKFVGVIHRIED